MISAAYTYEQRHPHPEYCFDYSGVNLEKLRAKAIRGEFGEQIVDDFRRTFRFSQGSARGQYILMYLLGLQYFQAGKEVRKAVIKNLPLITETEWRRAAQPPKGHSQEDEEHLNRESIAEWNKFQRLVSPLYVANEITHAEMVENYGELLLQYVHFMINSDTVQIYRGRPMRISPERANASFVREHMLAGHSTGSPTFNELFRDTQRIILTYPPNGLNQLATLWRSRHQGAEFYPPDFMERAADQGTQPLFGYSPATGYFDDFSDGREIVLGAFNNKAQEDHVWNTSCS